MGMPRSGSRLATGLGCLRDEGIEIVAVDLEKMMCEDYLMQQALTEGRIYIALPYRGKAFRGPNNVARRPDPRLESSHASYRSGNLLCRASIRVSMVNKRLS